METSNSILKNIEEIQESAMFQLSLSSMELFHSNFIYMLCRDSFKAKDQMSGIFNKFIGDKNLLIEGLPKREKLNFDLSFEFGKNDKITDVLIIENKVKAIATKEQLDRYVEKAKANYKGKILHFGLLAPSEPPFFDNGKYSKDNSASWVYYGYREFIGDLKTSVLPGVKDPYHKLLIEDYIRFVDNFLAISDHFDDYYFMASNPVIFENNSDNKNISDQLKEIRLDDYCHKKAYNNVAYMIYQKLTKLIGSEVQVDFTNTITETNPKHSILVDQSFSRKTAFIDIKYFFNEKKTKGLAVEIQGGQFRLAVFSDENVLKTAEKLLANRSWFNFESKFNRQKENKNDFNKYGDNYRYQYVKIDEALTIDQIIDITTDYIKEIHTNVNSYQDFY